MPPALLIMGPTAAGKTALAVELVKRFPFDIISVDSAMVYRGMDIGTAKPDAATRAVAPHRLIDLRDPSDAYSAADFCHDARREIADIVRRGRIPLLIGGTMLYFRALQQGLTPLPSANPRLRARLQAEQQRLGNAALHARLAAVDPTAAARIHCNDPQRVQRALEVFELTGRPLTELYTASDAQSIALNSVKLVLTPGAGHERRQLHARIATRFHAMLEQGLIAEVENLYRRPELNIEKPALRAVGYRQIWQYLEGTKTHAEMVVSALSATRQFAKRQLTWLRAEPNAVWLDSSRQPLLDRVVNELRAQQLLP